MSKTNRRGRFQHMVVRGERDSDFLDEVIEGKIKSGVARETDEVVPLKDISPTAGIVDRENIAEYSEDELARRAAEASSQFQNHYLIWENNYAVCTSCPFQHTIPLDPNKYNLVDGKIVKKEPLAKKH